MCSILRKPLGTIVESFYNRGCGKLLKMIHKLVPWMILGAIYSPWDKLMALQKLSGLSSFLGIIRRFRFLFYPRSIGSMKVL